VYNFTLPDWASPNHGAFGTSTEKTFFSFVALQKPAPKGLTTRQILLLKIVADFLASSQKNLEIEGQATAMGRSQNTRKGEYQ
jgi:hypothetical protein